MKIAYFDCVAGASGDMILGALVDAGLPAETLRAELERLRLPEFELAIKKVSKKGFAATKVDVLVTGEVPERHFPDIQAILHRSEIPEQTRTTALQMFRRLCEVEAHIHGTSPDKVHLHELGGVDTIVDVVGALSGLQALGIEKIYASPLPMGRGFVTGAHGSIPLPAPATAALLKNVPIYGLDIQAELVTPTGAVLLSTLAHRFGPFPDLTLSAVGYGAGSQDLPIPNLLRVFIGEEILSETRHAENLMLLETNIDDLNPEIYDHVMHQLFLAGALDVFFLPIQMKKNRPATMIQVLCPPGLTGPLEQILFSETSTLGIRRQMVSRICLPRAVEKVETEYGPVRIKISRLADGRKKFTPEYEDCRLLAVEKSVPLREVYLAAQQAARNLPSTNSSRS